MKNNKKQNVFLYSKDSKVIQFTAKNNEVLSIEIIENPDQKLKSITHKVVNDLKKLTKKAWGDPGDLAEKWFCLADILVVVRKGDSLKGFSIGKYLRDNILLLPATMILPEDQNKGLATFMNSIILKKAWDRRTKKALQRIWRWIQPFYFVFRTPNPLLYSAIFKKCRVAPSIDEAIPSSLEVEIAAEVANTFSPDCKFNSKTFIMEGALLPYSGLVYDIDEIPWSRDKEINKFFEEYLKLKERKGNELIVVARLPFFFKMRLIKQL